MTEPTFDHLASLHTLEGLTVPRIAQKLAGDASPELEWRNDLGGLTFWLGDRFLKWNPRSTGVDLDRERVRWVGSRNGTPPRGSSVTASMAMLSGC